MFSFTVGPCAKRLIPFPSTAALEKPLPERLALVEFQSRMMSCLGGTQQFIGAFEKLSLYWEPRQIITILNLQCGDGELARILMKWGRRKRFDLRIIAADPDHRLIQIAKDHKGAHNDIYFETKNFTDSSYLQAQQFDYVINEGSLHHYDEETAISFLKKVNLLAKRGFVLIDGVCDLRRWGAVKLLSPANENLKKEILNSVQQSFSKKEIHVLLTAARLDLAQAFYPWGVWAVIQSERKLVAAAELEAIPTLMGT